MRILVDGLIWIVLGILASYIINNLTGSPFSLSIGSIFLAFVAIGILFGWYQGRRAPQPQTIEALWYE